jgi:D-alanyl-D-alanine carboxypeptidase/D-alanyl-D-alanine-endopeptidase (penicillin-binding protein 4)
VLAFAIFAADLPRRAGIPAEQRERPAGGSEWTRRARGMQARVVERWATVHA